MGFYKNQKVFDEFNDFPYEIDQGFLPRSIDRSWLVVHRSNS
ncbi:unnamed protein product [Acidithrix sp. C25]|nr:unnamed protein product [Acidithrix sp. C25]